MEVHQPSARFMQIKSASDTRLRESLHERRKMTDIVARKIEALPVHRYLPVAIVDDVALLVWVLQLQPLSDKGSLQRQDSAQP